MRPLAFLHRLVLVTSLAVYFCTAPAQVVKDAKYYLTKGNELFEKNKFDDAIVNYTTSIRFDPNYAIAYASRGYSYVQKKKIELALLDCNKAISLEPGQPDFYFYRGTAYYQKKIVDSAITDYTKAISLGPDSSDYYTYRAIAYTQKELPDLAIADYTKSINLRPDSSLYSRRGDLYVQIRNYESAIHDYTQLININPGTAENYRRRCKAYYYNNQTDLALQDVIKAFSVDPANFINNNYRGLCFNSLGRYDASVLDFLTYILKRPDHGYPYINIISPLVRLKRFNEAILFYSLQQEKKLKTYLDDEKYKFYIYFIKAVAQVAEGRLEQALNSLDTASKEYGPEPKDETKRLYSDVLSLNGYVLEKLDRLEDAKVNYEQSLVIDSRQPDLLDALTALEKKQVLTRELDKTPPEIKLIYANLPTRGFDIVADTNKVPVMGKATDKSGIEAVKINGMAAKVEADGFFFANLALKAGITSLEIMATDKQKNIATSKFDLNKLANEMVQRSFKTEETVAIGKYHAILIAEKDYADSTIPDLRTPIRDAGVLRNILIDQYTFDSTNVDTLYNRSREEILETIIAKCKALTDKDNLLIFYAGHGDTTQDKMGNVDGYLVPSSAKKGKTSYYITSEEIKKALLKSNAKHVLVVLDACYSGAFTRDLSPAVPDDIMKQYKLDSRKVMSSGNIEVVPDDSQFILYFTQFLQKNTEKYISAKGLWEFVSKEVKSTLAQYGDITGAGDRGGQFVFERR